MVQYPTAEMDHCKGNLLISCPSGDATYWLQDLIRKQGLPSSLPPPPRPFTLSLVAWLSQRIVLLGRFHQPERVSS